MSACSLTVLFALQARTNIFYLFLSQTPRTIYGRYNNNKKENSMRANQNGEFPVEHG